MAAPELGGLMTEGVIVALITAAAVIISALITNKKLNAIHILVNGRLSIALAEVAALKEALVKAEQSKKEK